MQGLLRRAKRLPVVDGDERLPEPTLVEPLSDDLPEFVIAIDGSSAEVDVSTGYPGSRIGYVTVASVLLNLRLVDILDEDRPVDPVKFRSTEEADTIPAALPGSNVVTRDYPSARDSFRAELYDLLQDAEVDEDDDSTPLETFEILLRHKPRDRPQRCPYEYDGCQETMAVDPGLSDCHCPKRRVIFSTDALRIHEGFKDDSSNLEMLTEVMQVWERIMLVHLLLCFERKGLLAKANKVAFFVDGPLAIFGHPAWLSAAIKAELQRINAIVRRETGSDLIIVGIEKSGSFVQHFEDLASIKLDDDTLLFQGRACFLPTDIYIKSRIIYSNSDKRYGEATYFGRKFFYRTSNLSRVVASVPFLDETQDSLDSSDPVTYPQLPTVCALLDKLVSSRFANAVSPIIAAHAHAAIPFTLGSKVLHRLAVALMRDEK
ncbi:DNA double-strand break repair nuclease NurA [Micromonospora sp. WMMD729]|uniref:DNA double-strand break repair nuclease NurA n=1 Tax=Micromonospora sp. WMMD729 TaxID=3404127 RepID=UPI003BF5A4CA